MLEATFQQHHYPTVDMVDELVEQLDLPTQKITVCLKERVTKSFILLVAWMFFNSKVWFQNRRARLKKSQPKIDEEKLLIKEETPQYDSGIHLVKRIMNHSLSVILNSLSWMIYLKGRRFLTRIIIKSDASGIRSSSIDPKPSCPTRKLLSTWTCSNIACAYLAEFPVIF